MKIHPAVYLLGYGAGLSRTLEVLINAIGLQAYIYQDPSEFLVCLSEHAYGCLILDVRMPKMSGLQVLKELKRRRSDLTVVFLSSCHDIGAAVDALKKGALEFITKPYSEQKLLDTIYIAVDESQKLHQKSLRLRQIAECIDSLTKREFQILDCISKGMINKVISRELHISSKTVEMHRANVMRKMCAKNIAELITVYTFYNLETETLRVF